MPADVVLETDLAGLRRINRGKVRDLYELDGPFDAAQGRPAFGSEAQARRGAAVPHRSSCRQCHGDRRHCATARE